MLLFLGFLVLLVFTVDGVFREANEDEFPFQVSIQDEKKQHLCGGAVIAPKWVITSSMCLVGVDRIRVAYGSVRLTSGTKSVRSAKIEHEPVYVQTIKNRLSAIKLESPIQGQASLASCCSKLPNSTKLSGWKAEVGQSGGSTVLYVSDTYSVISDICRIPNLGASVKLGADEFCGMDEDKQTKLLDTGTLVSLKSTILGLLAYPPAGGLPPTFMRLANHEQWIKSVLGPDAGDIKWEEVPSYAGDSYSKPTGAILLGISVFLLNFI